MLKQGSDSALLAQIFGVLLYLISNKFEIRIINFQLSMKESLLFLLLLLSIISITTTVVIEEALTQNSQNVQVAKNAETAQFQLEDSVNRILQSTSLPRPIRFGYINRIATWWPPQKIAEGLGVPGYAPSHVYNYFALSFWTYLNGPKDMAKLWAYPTTYFGYSSVFGNTDTAIRTNLKKKYNDNNIKIMVSAFGDTQFPTTMNVDPILCAVKLAKFVKDYNLDGVDIDWQDSTTFNSGNSQGQNWLISFTTKLRAELPTQIITHAPQAPHFKEEVYAGGAYMKVHRQVGDLINFYNIQFYNQQATTYDTYTKLFTSSGGYFAGTSVKEIINRGVPALKVVVGKPSASQAAKNTGYVDPSTLKSFVQKAKNQTGWNTGIMFWEYYWDSNGTKMKTAISPLYP